MKSKLTLSTMSSQQAVTSVYVDEDEINTQKQANKKKSPVSDPVIDELLKDTPSDKKQGAKHQKSTLAQSGKRNIMPIILASVVIVAVILFLIYTFSKKAGKSAFLSTLFKSNESSKQPPPDAKEEQPIIKTLQLKHNNEIQQFQNVLESRNQEILSLRQQMGQLNERLKSYSNAAVVDKAVEEAEQRLADIEVQEAAQQEEEKEKPHIITKAEYDEHKKRKNAAMKAQGETKLQEEDSDKSQDDKTESPSESSDEKEAKKPKMKKRLHGKSKRSSKQASDDSEEPTESSSSKDQVIKMTPSSKIGDKEFAAILGTGSIKSSSSD